MCPLERAPYQKHLRDELGSEGVEQRLRRTRKIRRTRAVRIVLGTDRLHSIGQSLDGSRWN